MSVDIQELSAEVADEANRNRALYQPDTSAQPQKMQKMMRQAAERAAWACERLKA